MRPGTILLGSLLLFFLATTRVFSADGPPSISISPAGYDFGTLTLEVGSATSVFIVSNTGGADLEITDISLRDRRNYSLDFRASVQPCGKTAVLAPGASCTFGVRFRPKKEGPLDTEISVFSNDPALKRLIVPLAGFGGICHC